MKYSLYEYVNYCSSLLPFEPELMHDLVSLSPVYHDKELVLQAAQLPSDGQVFLHLLWLIWAFGVFGISAIWVYQRDRSIQ